MDQPLVSFFDQLLLVVLQILPVIFGFLLGFVAQILLDRRKATKKRNSLAVVLAFEILSMAESAKTSAESHRKRIEIVEKKEKDSEAAMGITDANFPTDVYDKLLTDLGLFEERTVSVITELYRSVHQAHNFKTLNQQTISEVEEVLAKVSNRALSDVEKTMLDIKSRRTVFYARVYLKTLERIGLLAEDAITRLSAVKKVDTNRLGIGLTEPITDEFPPQSS
ncbi:MAG: hypothetical protein V3U49_01385 [Nitrososphaerales archaeon]